MDVTTVNQTDFVVLRADWTVKAAVALLTRLPSAYAIIHREDRTNGAVERYYYLWERENLLTALSGIAETVTIRDALGLRETDASPSVDLATPAEETPPGAVVLEDGRPIGMFFGDAIPKGDALTRRGTGAHAQTPTPAPQVEPETEASFDAPPARPPIERSLVAELPGSVPADQTVTLLVSLTAPVSPGGAGAVPIRLPANEVVDVLIRPMRGFVMAGPDTGRLTVSASDQELLFTLRALDEGAGEVRVRASHQGQKVGELTVTTTIVGAQRGASRVAAGLERRETRLSDVSVPPADLTLLIYREGQGDQTALEFTLSTLDAGWGVEPFKRYPPVPLQADAAEYFATFFEDIESLPLDTARQRKVAGIKLASKGADLFGKVFPKELQEDLWRLRDRITSIQVRSEEPWIPWEVCRLCGEVDGEQQEGGFLGEKFAITRWIEKIPTRPRLTLRRMAAVVPSDSGLAFAFKERDDLKALATSRRRVMEDVPATFLELREALASGVYDGWHFSGHGLAGKSDPDRSVMTLENGEELTPEELAGEVRNLGKTQPLVFLNACQIGRGGLSLTGIGGWAGRFLQAGAAAFVGAYWSVSDEPAADFARAFYRNLLDGTPIGEAARLARQEVSDAADPTTWLAYTVFAHPFATVASVDG